MVCCWFVLSQHTLVIEALLCSSSMRMYFKHCFAVLVLPKGMSVVCCRQPCMAARGAAEQSGDYRRR